jgi:hypothetical protein
VVDPIQDIDIVKIEMIDPIQVRDYGEQDEDSDIDLEMRAIRAEEAADSNDEEKLEQGRAVSGRRSRSRSRRTALGEA